MIEAAIGASSLSGDRGMIAQARITADLKAAGLDWISALRAPAIKALLDGALQMSLFDDRDMAGITAPEFPGDYALALLKGYTGVLQTDGYAGYRALADPKRAGGPATLAFY